MNVNGGRFGNISTPSLPIVLDERVVADRLRSGHLVFLDAFGIGFSHG